MLRGAAVLLAPLRTDDVELLFEWINDRGDVHAAAGYKPVHESMHRSWLDSVTSGDDGVIFGIRTIEDDRLIGYVQLARIEPRARTAELRVRIGEQGSRARGLGHEACGLLLRYAFDDLNLRRVWAHTFATNEVVIRGADGLGFQREGVLRESAYVDGAYVDVVVIAVMRDEFQPPASITDGPAHD